VTSLTASARSAHRKSRSRRAVTASTRTLISPATMNRGRNRIYYRIVLTVVIVVFTAAFIGPLYFLFTDASKPTLEAIADPPTYYPHHLELNNFANAWDALSMGRLFFNTFYYAIGALVFQLIFDVTAAYAISRLRPMLGNVIFLMMLATLMIPSTVLIVPQYLTAANLPFIHVNIIGTPEVIWLPTVANAFNIFLLKRFFDSIPRDLLDAASVDGASPLRVLLRIVIPISRPILAVVSIFAFVGVWKDFLWPLLVEYGYQPTRFTLNVGISQSPQIAENLILAASAMAAIPTIVFFLVFQRNIVAGLTAGGIKS
jgi:multiple sugar transport system permease protein